MPVLIKYLEDTKEVFSSSLLTLKGWAFTYQEVENVFKDSAMFLSYSYQEKIYFSMLDQDQNYYSVRWSREFDFSKLIYLKWKNSQSLITTDSIAKVLIIAMVKNENI
mmetsp:Transcript_24800/g.22021  ORF Transcript_24800/g.22021 Transcript_24800/m.22021 type:complete len:108 (-) Transcript_24800:1390-1713(-)